MLILKKVNIDSIIFSHLQIIFNSAIPPIMSYVVSLLLLFDPDSIKDHALYFLYIFL